jgi:hypothetical protein
MRSELGAVTMNIAVLSNVTACILVEMNKNWEKIAAILSRSQGALNFSEAFVTLYQILKSSISKA